MTKILLVDDDRRHSELLQAYCRRFGMQVDCAYNGEQGLSKLAVSTPDLVLLDIMMPGMDGFEFCRQVRKTSNIPIIMLTARGDVIDRVSGLELGADDYVGKPFEPRELVARIQSILRRADTAPTSEKELQFGDLRIDNDARCAYLADERLALTSMEFELLSMLARNAGKELSRDEILSGLRGIDAAILTRSVDIMISRLRQKLNDSAKPPKYIQTVWGRGYCFVGRATEHA